MGSELPPSPSWEDGWLSSAQRIPSPNFGPRPVSPSCVNLLVIHAISLPPGDFEDAWVELFFQNQLPAACHPYFGTIADLKVSAHFYIRRDGRLIQFVSCDQRAWHAGASSWDGKENCNDFSIGIELEGGDEQSFTPNQYEMLVTLSKLLRRKYPITDIAGHCHVSPGRKTDPGPYFDWKRLSEALPGLTFPVEEVF